MEKIRSKCVSGIVYISSCMMINSCLLLTDNSLLLLFLYQNKAKHWREQVSAIFGQALELELQKCDMVLVF